MLRLPILIIVLGLISVAARAVQYDYFSLHGFYQLDLGYATNQCPDCARFPNEDRQRIWADQIPAGQDYGPATNSVTLFQPYLGFGKFHLGNGFKLQALISQRWRDGQIDIPGGSSWYGLDSTWYERNISISHDYYGLLQLGQYPLRAWSIPDHPTGSTLGIADAWGSSGSGYGISSIRAVRFAPEIQYVFGGDLYTEFTIDFGDPDYSAYSSRLYELYLQYVKRGAVLELIYQLGINGLPGSWTHGPFKGITNEAKYEQIAKDKGLEENQQSVLIAMYRFPLNVKTMIYSAIRRNNWSGQEAVQLEFREDGDIWNNMFNVNWFDADRNPSGDNRGYAAASTDFMLGLTYAFKPYDFRLATIHLGKADTDNPLERGQSNSLQLSTIGLGYEYRPGLSMGVGMTYVSYAQQGLAPLSMPAHASYSGVDPRVKTDGLAYTGTFKYVW